MYSIYYSLIDYTYMYLTVMIYDDQQLSTVGIQQISNYYGPLGQASDMLPCCELYYNIYLTKYFQKLICLGITCNA